MDGEIITTCNENTGCYSHHVVSTILIPTWENVMSDVLNKVAYHFTGPKLRDGTPLPAIGRKYGGGGVWASI